MLEGIPVSIVSAWLYDVLYKEKAWKRSVEKVVHKWSSGIEGCVEGVFLSQLKNAIASKRDNTNAGLQGEEALSIVPSESEICLVLFNTWEQVRRDLAEEERDAFFNILEEEAKSKLSELARELVKEISTTPPFRDRVLYEKVERILKLCNFFSETKWLSNADRTKNADHFYLPGDNNLHVSDIFINPMNIVHSLDRESSAIVEKGVESVGWLQKTIKHQKLVFVVGQYGSGKTTLLKKFQLQMIENGEACLFVKGKDVSEGIYVDIKNANIKFICIDGAEDVPGIYENDYTDWSDFLVNIFDLSCSCDVNIVVSMRAVGVEYYKLYDDIYVLYDDMFSLPNPEMLELQYFDSDHKKSWISSYNWTSKDDEGRRDVAYSEINRSVKSLDRATRNPLFLYAYCQFISSNDNGSDINLYTIYDGFIRQTIKGKYSKGEIHRKGLLKTDDSERLYREFLRDVSVKISTSREVVDKQFVDNGVVNSNWYVDPNERRYEISYREIIGLSSRFIQDCYGKEIDVDEVGNDSRFLINGLLSCYFFEGTQKYCYFTDNNIVHFFAAESNFDVLCRAVGKFVSEGSVFSVFNDKKSISGVSVTPVSISILRFKIQENIKKKPDFKDNLLSFVEEYFRKKESSASDNGIILSRDVVLFETVILIVYFLFLDRRVDVEEIFKYYFDMVGASRIFNVSIDTVLLRFLARCKIIGAELELLNLSDANLNGSSVSNSNIRLCKLKKVDFSAAQFEVCEFSECSLDKVYFNAASGDLNFTNCTLKNIEILKAKALKLVFKGCKIDGMNISMTSGDLLGDSGMVFSECHINNLRIKNTRLPMSDQFASVKFARCIMNTPIVRHSEFACELDNNHCLNGGGKRYFQETASKLKVIMIS